MVKIRLMRMGATKRPFYRVVVADSRSPRDGRFIENIGKYHPLEDPSLIDIDEDRALYWLSKGAQPTEQARQPVGRGGRHRHPRGREHAAQQRPGRAGVIEVNVREQDCRQVGDAHAGRLQFAPHRRQRARRPGVDDRGAARSEQQRGSDDARQALKKRIAVGHSGG